MSDPTLRVGILGATGAVGQTFVRRLADHPWFSIHTLAASERSAGKPYREAANWLSSRPMPDAVTDMEVVPCTPNAVEADLVFSGLDSAVAGEIEADFAHAGFPVISNAKNYRMDPTVPLLIPEINPEHAALIDEQSWENGGFIVTNPNCSTVGLVCALRPLVEAFTVEAVQVTMLQALSGAGYPGVASLDALGNVIPYIGGEEDKLDEEPRKILGTYENGAIKEAKLAVSAQCNRVPVRNGHLACASVRFSEKISPEAAEEALRTYTSPVDVSALPSAPDRLVAVDSAPDAPQPRKHVYAGNGMTVTVGRIQACTVNHVKFVALSHNTIRGAAGGAILNAEQLVHEGRIQPVAA